jgi:hypothetical protein
LPVRLHSISSIALDRCRFAPGAEADINTPRGSDGSVGIDPNWRSTHRE